jgi:AsmA protein
MLPRTWVGWVVFAVVGLIVLAVAGVALLLFMLPRTELRDDFERQIERATGRDVELAGTLKVALFPVLGFSATDVRIANVAGGRAAHLAEAREIAAGLEIIPYVLRRQVIVDRLVLVEPSIHLELDAQGRPNWNLTPPRPSAPTRTPRPSAALRDIQLKEVRVSGARIDYLDRRDGDTWVFENSNLSTSVTSLDRPVNVKGSVAWRGEKVDIDITMDQLRPALRGQQVHLKATLESVPLGARFDGFVSSSGEYFVGNAAALGPSVRRLSTWLGAAIPNGANPTLGAFDVNGRLTVTRKRIAFENATVALDTLRGRGDFTLESHQGRPYISGRLEFAELDINPYLAPPATAGGPVTVEAAAAQVVEQAPDARRPWPTQPIDLSALKAIDANLDLFVTTSFKVQRLQVGRAELSTVLNGGFLAATLHRLDLYGGAGRGRVELDAREPALRFAQELNVNGVRAQDFLRDAAGFQGLEGPANVTINWAGQGTNQDALISSLDGRVQVQMQQGALRGVDLGGVAKTIRNALTGNLVNPNARTNFSSMSGSFAVADGIMATDNFRANTSDLRIDGLGVINVGEQNLLIRITPREGGIAIPFIVRGPWARLQYVSDLRGRERPGVQAQVRTVQQHAPPAR